MPGREQSWHNEVCQEEVPKVIGAKLAFNAVCRLSKGARHDCSIVDQDIDLLDASIDVCGSFSYRCLTTEIDADKLSVHLWVDGVDAIND